MAKNELQAKLLIGIKLLAENNIENERKDIFSKCIRDHKSKMELSVINWVKYLNGKLSLATKGTEKQDEFEEQMNSDLHYEALHVLSCPALCLCVSSVLLVF